MASRVLGLVREHIFAKLFGTHLVADAFVMAFRIPNLLRELVAEGALSMAFVPIFTEYKEQRGDEAAFRLAQVVFTGLLIVVGALSLAAYLFTPELVDLIAPGFADYSENYGGHDIAKRDLTITLTRVMIPFLLAASWAALCKGVLNTYNRYFLPALSPVMFNLAAVATGYVMYAVDLGRDRAILGWAAATLTGAVLQFAIQLPPMRKLGFRFRLLFALTDRGLRRILTSMGPAVLGLAAVQINIFVNSRLASEFANGPVAMLNYAYRLVYLPIGLIGVAIATVTTVKVSRAAADKDLVGLGRDLTASLRMLSFLTLPCTVGLIVLAQPIVELVFGYGKFAARADAAELTAIALCCYTWALSCYCGVKVVAPVFYALGEVRWPVFASVTAVIANLAWSLSTTPILGWKTLALGTALAGLVNFVVLALVARRLLPSLEWRPIARASAVCLLLCLPMAATAWGVHTGLSRWIGETNMIQRALVTTPAIALAIVVYVAIARWIGMPEARLITLRRQHR